MASPFPGMDPYLEHPNFWSGVHSRLIVAIADAVALSIRPKYYVEIEKRTYLSDIEDSLLVGIPDVVVFSQSSESKSATATLPLPYQEATMVTVPLVEEITERYLEIRETQTGKVIATIEVLSPKNKRSGIGRDAYENKRKQILASLTHLVEIDLLRGGMPMPILGDQQLSDYRILISRGDRRPIAHLYAFSLRDRIPSFPLPLSAGDTEPIIELQDLLNGVYERASLDLRVDYTQPVVPSLSQNDATWADALLKEKTIG